VEGLEGELRGGREAKEESLLSILESDQGWRRRKVRGEKGSRSGFSKFRVSFSASVDSRWGGGEKKGRGRREREGGTEGRMRSVVAIAILAAGGNAVERKEFRGKKGKGIQADVASYVFFALSDFEGAANVAGRGKLRERRGERTPDYFHF